MRRASVLVLCATLFAVAVHAVVVPSFNVEVCEQGTEET